MRALQRLVAAVMVFLATCAAVPFNGFDRLRVVNDYVATALRELSSDVSVQSALPHILIMGDQGVGKSTTLNRLLQVNVFPMRSKERQKLMHRRQQLQLLYTIKMEWRRVFMSTAQVRRLLWFFF